MRNGIIAGAALALVAAAAPLAAQDIGWTVGVNGGVTVPMGDAGDAYDAGFGGGVIIGMRPAQRGIGYGVEAQIHRLGIKDVDGNLTGFAAFGRLNFPVAEQVYLIGGAGAFRAETSLGSSNVKVTNTDFAIQGGLGVNFGRNLFAEAKLINVFGDESSQFIPITIGFRF